MAPHEFYAFMTKSVHFGNSLTLARTWGGGVDATPKTGFLGCTLYF